MSVLKFGKYKDQEISEVAKTEKGRQWLGWFVEQPSTDPKFKHANDALKAQIRKTLQDYADGVPSTPSRIEKEAQQDLSQAVGLGEVFRKISGLFAEASAMVKTDVKPQEKEQWTE